MRFYGAEYNNIERGETERFPQLFDLRAVCRGNNELFLVPWNKTLKCLNYFLLIFIVKYNNSSYQCSANFGTATDLL
jgi:hypothetical protein